MRLASQVILSYKMPNGSFVEIYAFTSYSFNKDIVSDTFVLVFDSIGTLCETFADSSESHMRIAYVTVFDFKDLTYQNS